MTLLAGDIGPVVNLQDARRHLWEKNARLIDERIEKEAKESGRADVAEWGQIGEEFEKTKAAVAARDSAAMQASALRLVQMATPPAKPLGPYKPRPRLDGVRVSFRLLSQSEHSRLIAPLVRLEREAAKLSDEQVDRYLEADAEAHAQQLAYIRRAVASIEHARAGWRDAGDLSDDTLHAIERFKLTADLFACAREAQNLDPFELATFGGSLPPISVAPSAIDARSTASKPSAASMMEPSGSAGPSTKLEPVPAASSTAIPTLPSSSSFTAVPMAESSDSTSPLSLSPL